MQSSKTKSCAAVQAAYSAIPYALSPVLGNPLAMAAVNVDRSASLPAQVSQAQNYQHIQSKACLSFYWVRIIRSAAE